MNYNTQESPNVQDTLTCNANLVKDAATHRQMWGHKGGVIIFYNSQINGWVNELRNPEQWVPGCIAIDEAGNQWVAQGGDHYKGAANWHQIWNV